MSRKAALWARWLERTLLPDITAPETPDPVPLFDEDDGEPVMSAAAKRYKRGKTDGDYLYLLYQLDGPDVTADAVTPVYVGESRNISRRLHQHATKILASLPTADWEDSGDWGSFSKYDHMALLFEQAASPLYVWIVDVAALEAGPYDYPTYRQELEAKLVGLIHSHPQFERICANREFVPNQILHEIGKVGPEWVSCDANLEDRSEPIDVDPNLASGSKADRWNDWVNRYVLTEIQDADSRDPIPLFNTEADGTVTLTQNGRLKRSDAIDTHIRREGKRCLTPERVPNDQYDGLLYMMYQLDGAPGSVSADDVIPLYIGKAEIYGKKRALSSNFTEIAHDRNGTRSFARWGDGNYWHIGTLSMALQGEDQRKAHWVDALFEEGTRRLSQPTYLWMRAWSRDDDIGPYGVPATLAETEALLIGLAYDRYPNRLLNKDGTPDDAPVKA